MFNKSKKARQTVFFMCPQAHEASAPAALLAQPTTIATLVCATGTRRVTAAARPFPALSDAHTAVCAVADGRAGAAAALTSAARLGSRDGGTGMRIVHASCADRLDRPDA